MPKKKLLVLNGSHSEIPLIRAAKQLGFHVITTGNAPSLIGHAYADEYHNADFSNKDEILQLSRKLKIDNICSSANDFGAITASYVAGNMGLPGHDDYETSLIVHHKDLFKIFSSENLIQTPHAESFDNEEAAISAMTHLHLPVIIKPIDLTGGKGITKVHSKHEYAPAIKKAFQTSREKRIVIEEFFQGTQHSFSSFIIDGKVRFYFSDNEFSFLNPFLVSTSAAPATNIDKFSEELIASAEKMASTLQLVDGILHIQYLASGDSFTIIEVTRRCSGDLYPYPVQYSSNLDWAQWIVKAEAGFDCSDFPTNAKQKGFCGRHCIMADRNGIIEDVIIDKEIKKNIHHEVMWWKKGQAIDNYMSQKLGVLILHYASENEMVEKTNIINQLVKVSVKHPQPHA